MYQLERYDVLFKTFTENLDHWLPDGLIDINLKMLNSLDLLYFNEIHGHELQKKDMLNQHFHVFETDEKVTLVNEDYVIWIVPYSEDNSHATFTLIARKIGEDDFKMEMGFRASGVYNYSKLVLRVLEEMLREIADTEAELGRMFKEF